MKKIYSDTVIKKVKVHLTLGPYKFFFAGYRFLLFSEALDKNFRNLSTKFHANRSSIKKVIKEKQKKKQKKVKYKLSSNLYIWTNNKNSNHFQLIIFSTLMSTNFCLSICSISWRQWPKNVETKWVILQIVYLKWGNTKRVNVFCFRFPLGYQIFSS